jgi:hypothetical protein
MSVRSVLKWRKTLAVIGLCLTPMLLGAATPPLNFVAAEPGFAAASAQYRSLWCSEGSRIIAVLERVSGFSFPASPIEVFVFQGPPMTAYDGRTIWLKASYPEYYKRATLVHELGHRLAATMPRTADLDDHRLLYLFLYDAWTELYGAPFADRMVQIERRIAGRYDYAGAWDWTLIQTREQRQARLASLRPISSNGVTARDGQSAATPPSCPGV